MKIQKFNENIENKNYHVCIIIDDQSSVEDTAIFETQEDMTNWILNLVNEKYLEISDDRNIFIDLIEAINWYQDEMQTNINYDNSVSMHKNVKLRYGVERLRASKKYNL